MRITKVADDETLGKLALPVSVPAEGKYTVWARCRGTGLLTAMRTGDRPMSRQPQAKVDSEPWRWVRFDMPLVLDLQAKSVSLISRDDRLAIDKIVVTDDGKYAPAGADDRTPLPPSLAGLAVKETTTNSVTLAWEPSPADPHYYSVYVGEKADFECGNETLLCSTHRTSAVDWDVPAGKTHVYKVVAVDRRCKASEPAVVTAKTRAMKRFLVDLPAVKGDAGGRIVKGKDVDVDYVAGPKTDSDEVALTFNVPADGRYYLWAEYGARFGKPKGFAIKLDDKDGQWRTAQPTRMGRDLKGSVARWFVHRIRASKRYRAVDLTNLNAGRHTLTFTLDAQSPLLSKVWVTNDPSYVPPGYNTQSRMNRDRRQK